MTQPQALLQIENLSTAYEVGGAWLNALNEISLSISHGQSYGLVGESGSGKSTLALAAMNYLPRNGRVQNGRVSFDGLNLLDLDDTRMRQYWGAQLSMVPQNSITALNPSIRVGEQFIESLCLHMGMDKHAAISRMQEELNKVHLADPDRVAKSYPHQLSGGMLQRILIAMAMMTRPKLLVLDEPTTNLDVTTQAGILDLISEMIRGSQPAILYVTHNLSVVAQVCSHVAVLYAGELVEVADVNILFTRPLHPYTQALLECIPKLDSIHRAGALRSIPGSIPAIKERNQGCVFAPRCPLAIAICQERPLMTIVDSNHQVRCHRWEELSKGAHAFLNNEGIEAVYPGGGIVKERFAKERTTEKGGLVLRNVSAGYKLSRTLKELITGRPTKELNVIKKISLSVAKGSTLGLVGESGSGKTTLARTILGLVERSAGDVELDELLLPVGIQGRSLEILRKVQMVFQSSEDALNPYRTVGESLSQPFITLHGLSHPQAALQAKKLLGSVHLPESFFHRLPAELSGGEKQRVAIARAVACYPELLITDELVSSLDVSVQSSILNLLEQLQRESGMSVLFISHDLAATSRQADAVAVIYLGELMQISPVENFAIPPYHPYTEVLLSAMARPDPNQRLGRIKLDGEIPSFGDRPTGCPFHTRCPRNLGEICVTQQPTRQTDQTGVQIWCHIPLDELQKMQANAFQTTGSNQSP